MTLLRFVIVFGVVFLVGLGGTFVSEGALRSTQNQYRREHIRGRIVLFDGMARFGAAGLLATLAVHVVGGLIGP